MDRTLLLVDDEANILSALTRLFRRDGYRILSAGSGRDGLEVLRANPVGVIISDQRMPGMTGTEFLSEAKILQPESVRIVLSGYTELNSVTDAINRGSVFRFLTKPWEDELLREQVRDAFGHYELKMNCARLSDELVQKNAALEDIRRQLEAALAEVRSERDFGMSVLSVTQQVLHQAPVAIVGFAPDGTVAVCNRLATTLFPALCAGSALRQALPAALLALLDTGHAAGRYRADDGSEQVFQLSPLLAGQATLGHILTLVPAPGGAGAETAP
ncbi:response regulator [Chitinimonas koreensis]|uniref:response regulator n=1 Tax=Chitinimonas koreensis TaxID=356302 RepID=UPI0012F850F1|nr:response regulator [Chitinimonas koreensis]QNM95676.1 response regulator [Chitinimonas koreensis]